MTTRLKLTPARRKALEVLAERHAKGRSGRVSNITNAGEGLVYWQSANWLVDQGLAEPVGGRHEYFVYLRITEAGLEALA